MKTDIDMDKVLQYIKENPGVTTLALQTQFELTKHGISVLTGALDRSGLIKKFPRYKRGTIYYDKEYEGPISKNDKTSQMQGDQYVSNLSKSLLTSRWGKTLQL